MTIGKFLHGSVTGIVAVALAAGALAPAAHASAGFGAVPGPGGCLSSPGASEATHCQGAKGLVSPAALAVSPDGRNVYVVGGIGRGNVAGSFGAIAVLRRDPATGALSDAGCVSSDGTDGMDGASEQCAASPALLAADGVAVSPDGHTVYVTASSSGSIVAFARDAENGALTRTGCFQELPRPGSPCTGANVFSGDGDLVASPSALYIASALEGVISGLAAPPATPVEGELAPPPPAPASIFTATPGPFLVSPCIAVNGYDGACAVGTAMKGVDALTLSADGNQLYATAQGSEAVDEFVPGARGTLTEIGCLKAAAPKGLCQSSRYLTSPRGLAVSADGHNLYVADGGSPARPGGRVEVLARDAHGRLSDSSCLDYLLPERHQEKDEEGEGEEAEKEPPAPADPCTQVPGLAGAIALTVNAEGSTVSVFGPDSAATFSRDAATGKLTETSCAAGEDPRCSSLSGLDQVKAAAVSPDGRNVYLVTGREASVLALGVGAAVTSSTAVASRAGTTAVRVACPRAMSGPCRGRVLLDRTVMRRNVRHHHQAILRTVVASSAPFAIGAGRHALVRVRVAHSAQRLLLQRRRLRLTALVRAAPRGGGAGFGRLVVLRLNGH